MRIKSTTYSDVQQKPCQFYWHGLLHITIELFNKLRVLKGFDRVAAHFSCQTQGFDITGRLLYCPPNHF
jgi:hypothetical protein